MTWKRHSYTTNASMLGDAAIIICAFLFFISFVIWDLYYYVIPWAKSNPVDALEIAIIITSMTYIIWKITQTIIEYLGHGAGQWILEVIREIKGTSNNSITVTQQKKIDEKAIRLYDADPEDVRDAIDVLVKFGWKKVDAAQKVHSIVVSSSLHDVDTTTKIVKKVLAEMKL